MLNRIQTPIRSSKKFFSFARFKHSLPTLKYEYNAFAPVWSEAIVKNHYELNHAAYVNNLNANEEKLAASVTKNDLVSAAQLEKICRFNAGGHINHTRMWETIAPTSDNGGKLVSGTVEKAIEKTFGSVDELAKAVNAATASIQGSGWGWLAVSSATGNLHVLTTPNQDTVEDYGCLPLFGIDAWEHAFYLDYKTSKVDYFKKYWQIANWAQIQRNYDVAMASLKK
ncbi:hypothetical protein BB560_001309 [Smittium megazygosporum]|uniref:Superoxide dismutase n=1 Tax=Smittium megazygosporum TaxID=133381 RepID=A0A2T9Y2M9_9FUNG|nr:hypothetical protein BB560_006694 [Smittium megazygosporum]PVV04200.1 hypothetical protein BB560_001309 [Smittium megazygosporum]